MKDLGITPGKWKQSHRKTENGMYSTEVYSAETEQTIATMSWYPKPPQRELVEGEYKIVTHTYREANAKLIADSGTTANKCGLLPSELLAQRDELISVINSFIKDFEDNYVMRDGSIVDNPDSLLLANYKLLKNTIKKITE